MFGVVVKMCRQRLGITQEELAWRANLHRTYIADVERGGRNISLQSIASVAAALEVSVGALFDCVSNGMALSSGGASSGALGEVLIVEDDPADAELALRALRRARFMNPVKIVPDGEAALRLLHGTKARPLPLLMLIDLGLPGISGLDLLRRLREDERTRELPVAVVTGSRSDRNISECARLGAVNYIMKPIEFADLSRVTAKLNMTWSLPPHTRPDVSEPTL